MIALATSKNGRMADARAAARAQAERAVVATDAPACEAADVLVVGGIETLLLPAFSVLDGCGWTVRYQVTLNSAVEWLKKHRTFVALVEVGADWEDGVARLRNADNCGAVILAAHQELPTEEVLRTGAHSVLRLPVESYDLLWSMVTARREAHSGAMYSGEFR